MSKAVAKPQKKKKSTKKSSAGRGKFFSLRLLGLCLLLIFLIKHSFIFVIAGMLPTIVASIVDTSRSRSLFKAVAAFNFCGVAPYLADLLSRGNTSSAVQEMMFTPTVWLTMYAASGLGWAAVYLMPALAKSIVMQFSDNKVSKIEKEQKELIEEWGVEVKGDAA
jgi:hypothetical protein